MLLLELKEDSKALVGDWNRVASVWSRFLTFTAGFPFLSECNLMESTVLFPCVETLNI
jgi:hypothetical protein